MTHPEFVILPPFQNTIELARLQDALEDVALSRLLLDDEEQGAAVITTAQAPEIESEAIVLRVGDTALSLNIGSGSLFPTSEYIALVVAKVANGDASAQSVMLLGRGKTQEDLREYSWHRVGCISMPGDELVIDTFDARGESIGSYYVPPGDLAELTVLVRDQSWEFRTTGLNEPMST